MLSRLLIRELSQKMLLTGRCEDLVINLKGRWLVTGAAGFIGSHLVEELLRSPHTEVVGLDNFATGFQHNLDDVRLCVGEANWKRFRFVSGDIIDPQVCQESCRGVDYILHQAALGSVPRSIQDPITSHRANVDGFVNMLLAARDAKVKRFVYASSSAVYGDSAELPKVEARIGRQLSPYAVNKYVNELYAGVFSNLYPITTIGLRYFNVFGARQDPNGAYAAVVPRWIAALLRGEACVIYGDGKTSRDFCFIANVVQANLLAATTTNDQAVNQVYNVALGDQMDLNELQATIADAMTSLGCKGFPTAPRYENFREGDIRHSKADIAKAATLLGYKPTVKARDGMRQVVEWYLKKSRPKG